LGAWAAGVTVSVVAGGPANTVTLSAFYGGVRVTYVKDAADVAIAGVARSSRSTSNPRTMKRRQQLQKMATARHSLFPTTLMKGTPVN